MRAGVALGSNLGNRIQHLRAAVQWLRKISEGSLLFSRVYETEPVDCPAGSTSFLNAVCEIGYAGEIMELLHKTQAFERRRGRPRSRVRNAPRPLDMDLLYAGDRVLNSAKLVLPHPRISERRFVLQPLCDIRPDLVLPGQTSPVKKLLASLRDSGEARRYDEGLR